MTFPSRKALYGDPLTHAVLRLGKNPGSRMSCAILVSVRACVRSCGRCKTVSVRAVLAQVLDEEMGENNDDHQSKSAKSVLFKMRGVVRSQYRSVRAKRPYRPQTL